MRPIVQLFAYAYAVVLLVQAAPGLAQPAERCEIDATRSVARFGIAHVFVDRVTGSVRVQSGSIDIPAGSSVPLRVTAVLDATKIDTGDGDRDNSLESADYFDTRQFPTWTFSSTKVVATGTTAFSTDGMLTVRGVTQPEHLDLTIHAEAPERRYHAVGHIDRRAFGMKGTRLDPVIGNEAEVTLDIVCK